MQDDYLKKLFINEAKPALERHEGGGIDTSDATAESDDIRAGETAYVNDEKVIGSIEDYDGTYDGDGESALNSLKKLLDHTKSTKYMFYYNSNITDLTGYISYDDTENVTDMSYMFNNCSNLITVPPLNTSNVTNMRNMFENCTNLVSVSPIDIGKASISNMFNKCKSLQSVELLNTDNVTDFNYALAQTGITEMVLSAKKATSLQNVFYGCEKLQTVKVYTSKSLTGVASAFRDCPLLKTIDLSCFGSHSSSYSNTTFYRCYSLKAVILRSFAASYNLNSNAFTNCYHLTGTVDATYNPNGDKDCYIYVPRSMVDRLKAYTNWSTYADQIRALEDYTVDGTTSGELDESKI